MRTVTEIIPVGSSGASGSGPEDAAVLRLTHDMRHVRRKALPIPDGTRILIDLAEPTMLHHGDILLLDNGAKVRVEAAEEELLEIFAKDANHLTELAWHIGNRHLAAEIREDSIRILHDHVIVAMLEKLGATVVGTRGPFVPVRGAYSGSHDHHSHSHHHDHSALAHSDGG